MRGALDARLGTMNFTQRWPDGLRRQAMAAVWRHCNSACRSCSDLSRIRLRAAFSPAIVVVPFIAIAFAYWISASEHMTGEEITLDQPVPFSHAHHVGGLSLDCRYCHTGVETSPVAGIPPTLRFRQAPRNAEPRAPVRRRDASGDFCSRLSAGHAALRPTAWTMTRW
jgi:hypothetical protein